MVVQNEVRLILLPMDRNPHSAKNSRAVWEFS